MLDNNPHCNLRTACRYFLRSQALRWGNLAWVMPRITAEVWAMTWACDLSSISTISSNNTNPKYFYYLIKPCKQRYARQPFKTNACLFFSKMAFSWWRRLSLQLPHPIPSPSNVHLLPGATVYSGNGVTSEHLIFQRENQHHYPVMLAVLMVLNLTALTQRTCQFLCLLKDRKRQLAHPTWNTLSWRGERSYLISIYSRSLQSQGTLPTLFSDLSL